MKFGGLSILTDNMDQIIQFYSKVFDVGIEPSDIHTVFQVGDLSIAIYAKAAAVRDMGFDFSQHNGSGTVTMDFEVDDVDAEYGRLRKMGVAFVNKPVTRTWGARSFQFRDPDGNIVTFRSWERQ